MSKIISLILSMVILILLLCSCQPQVEEVYESSNLESSQIQSSTISDSSDDEAATFDSNSNVPLSEWQTAYLNFLEIKKDNHFYYTLIHIDDDNIPELYMSGTDEVTGDGIYSFKNGTIFEQRLARIGGASYIKKGGMLINQNGSMGACYTDVYKLTEKGFVQTFSAFSVEKIGHEENGDLTFSYEYSIEGKSVDQGKYETALNKAYDFKKSVRINHNNVDYDEIKKQIENYK